VSISASTKTTPTKLGEFTVRCAELCGLYHSQMQNLVHVVSEADFTAWINDQELVAMTNESEGAK
jgi:cytochrome c oxidase subunit 2